MFEWDEIKRKRNLSKHGVDFSIVWDMRWEKALHTHDGRREYGETRMVALVPSGDRLHTCIYTNRGNGVWRIISLRKSSENEEVRYEQAMDN